MNIFNLGDARKGLRPQSSLWGIEYKLLSTMYEHICNGQRCLDICMLDASEYAIIREYQLNHLINSGGPQGEKFEGQTKELCETLALSLIVSHFFYLWHIVR